MSRTRLRGGRINQKQRTRAEILRAAQRVLARGVVPSIDDIAAEAGMSRATVYRYFPTLDLLLVEAPLDEQTHDAGRVLPADVPAGDAQAAAERAVQVQRYFYDLVADNEPRFRLFLKASMEQWLATGGKLDESPRGGRRLPMLQQALAPVWDQLAPEMRMRLVYALAGLVSIESFIAMTDVCRLDRKKGREIAGWAVRLLTEAALREAGIAPRPSAAGRRR